MAKEREDSFADDPLEEINLDNDDLDDLLGDAGKEDSNSDSSDEADDDLLNSDDLLEEDDLLSADDLEPESSDSESDPDNSAEISEEELDSLLAEADAPAEDGGDDAPPEEPAIDLEEFEEVLSEDDSDDSDATDILGDDDSAAEYPEVPDTLPQELVSELEEEASDAEGSEEDDGGDTDVDAEALLDESEEEEKKTKGFKPKGKATKGKKGFAAKGDAGKGKNEPKKAAADLKKPAAAKSGGKTIDIICSECYSVLSLSATWSEDLVTCPECFHVGKKPDDSFLRTVSTAKARESKKAKMLTLLSILVIVSFAGFVFLKSAYGDANALTAAEQAPLQADVNSATTDLTNAKARNGLPLNKDKQEDLEPLETEVEKKTFALASFLGLPDETEKVDVVAAANSLSVVTTVENDAGTKEEVTTHHFLPKAAKNEHKEAVDLWAQICLYGGGLFLLLLIWQACRYEGNRWEAYF